MVDKDVESGFSSKNNVSHLTSARTPYHLYITPIGEIARQEYRGEGTSEKPYIVDWLLNDGENPQTWREAYKWFLTVFVAMATLAISFCSSAYVGDVQGLLQDFGASVEVVTLGISLFVLGFAVGPLIWAPFSEVLGRRILSIITYLALTAFNAGTAGSQNMSTGCKAFFFFHVYHSLADYYRC